MCTPSRQGHTAQSWPSAGPIEAILPWQQSALFCSQKTPQVGDLLPSTWLLGFEHSPCALLSINLSLKESRPDKLTPEWHAPEWHSPNDLVPGCSTSLNWPGRNSNHVRSASMHCLKPEQAGTQQAEECRVCAGFDLLLIGSYILASLCIARTDSSAAEADTLLHVRALARWDVQTASTSATRRRQMLGGAIFSELHAAYFGLYLLIYKLLLLLLTEMRC